MENLCNLGIVKRVRATKTVGFDVPDGNDHEANIFEHYTQLLQCLDGMLCMDWGDTTDGVDDIDGGETAIETAIDTHIFEHYKMVLHDMSEVRTGCFLLCFNIFTACGRKRRVLFWYQTLN